MDVLVSNLFWRNTKESAKDEYKVPDLVEDVILLDLTDIERALYEDADESEGQ